MIKGLDMLSIKRRTIIKLVVLAIMSLILLAGNSGAAFSTTSSYMTNAPGDLILSHEGRLYLWEKDVPMVTGECGENMTLLKEGYLFLYDNVTQIYIPSTDGTVESK